MSLHDYDVMCFNSTHWRFAAASMLHDWGLVVFNAGATECERLEAGCLSEEDQNRIHAILDSLSLHLWQMWWIGAICGEHVNGYYGLLYCMLLRWGKLTGWEAHNEETNAKIKPRKSGLNQRHMKLTSVSAGYQTFWRGVSAFAQLENVQGSKLTMSLTVMRFTVYVMLVNTFTVEFGLVWSNVIAKWVSFFFRSCGVVCEAFYSIKNAQGSGRGRPRKLRGRMSFAEGCGRGCW